ncbi:MAG: LysM peptidoglycan-binding domain-containing protein [Pararhodobacter sp.]
MGSIWQGKALLWGAGTVAGGGAVVGLIYAALREPAPPAPPADPAPLVQPAVPVEPAADTTQAAPPVDPPAAPAIAEPQAQDEAVDTAAPMTDTVDVAAAAPDAEAITLAPPAFDVVRIEADGGALVAGLAPAGAAVVLRLDGAALIESMADPAGQFVVLFALEPSSEAQVLTLEAALADGRVMQGEDQVILAPRPAPAPPPVAVAPVDAPVDVAELSPVPSPGASAVDRAVDPAGQAASEAVPVDVRDGSEPIDLAAAMPDALPPSPSDAAEEQAVALAGSTEPAAPAAFLLRGSGEVTLLDRAPQVMDNVVIDTISYSAGGEVQISGRAAGGADSPRLQIYLDNAPISMAQARNGDWASDLPMIEPGVYTLRVDQLDAAGGVVSRFETPFQREDPERLAAAQSRLQVPEQLSSQAGAESEPPDAAQEPHLQPESRTTETAQAPAETTATDATDVTDAAAPGAGEADAQADAPVIAQPAVQPETAPAARPAPVQLLTVQPGHSLWRISREHYGEGVRYVQIFQANREQIRNPDLIYPGQVFVLPD